MLNELIEGGFIAQTILVVLVWGGITFLAVTQRPIPDPLLDAGFVIIGFYFHTTMTQAVRAQRFHAQRMAQLQNSTSMHNPDK